MRWSLVRGGESSEGEERTVEEANPVHRSPGFKVAIAHINECRPCRILDLGPAIASSIEFFSAYSCVLRIADLFGRLADDKGCAETIRTNPGAFFDDLLEDESEPFDLVLAWTVLDRIGSKAAQCLATRLAEATRPGARLFAMTSAHENGAVGGHVFAIRGPDSLEYRAEENLAACPGRLNPAAFAHLLSGFSVDHSIVLRNGYHEHVAVRLRDGRS